MGHDVDMVDFQLNHAPDTYSSAYLLFLTSLAE